MRDAGGEWSISISFPEWEENWKGACAYYVINKSHLASSAGTALFHFLL